MLRHNLNQNENTPQTNPPPLDSHFMTKSDKKRNAEFLKKHGREITATDIIASFGGFSMGCAMDTGRRNPMSRSMDDGIVTERRSKNLTQ